MFHTDVNSIFIPSGQIIVMRFAKHALILFATLSVVELASALQHNVAWAQVTGAPATSNQAPGVRVTDEPSVTAPPESNSAPSAPLPSSSATLLNSRSFSIPFTVDAAGTQPAKVQLFVGRSNFGQTDQTIQWQLFEEAQPNAEQFQFTAPDDGIYFFTTRTIDVAGRAHSPGNRLEVVVNTLGPEIRLDAEADDSGRVDVRYEIKDVSPLKQVHLHYMTDTERVWHPIETAPLAATAKLSFTPQGHWDQISVQATAVDAAGNQKTTHRLVQRPRIAALPGGRYSAAPVTEAHAARPAPYRIPATGPDEVSTRPSGMPIVGQPVQWSGPAQPSATNSTRGVTVTAVPSGAAAGYQPPAGYENIPLPPPASLAEISNGFGLTAPNQDPSIRGGNSTQQPITPWNAVQPSHPEKASAARPRTPAEAMRPLGNELTRTSQNQLSGDALATDTTLPDTGIPLSGLSAPTSQTNIEQIPLSEEVVKDNAAYSAGRVAASVPVQTVIDPRTPLRYSESARFSLDYELEAVGSGGVEAVELWGSLDGGGTWKRWGSDPDRQSPFDIETNGEGTYAYRIVVLSTSGLASPRPLPSEPADIAVIVDSTKPEVKITGAKYGEGDRVGSLVIQYSANDTHLLPRPIALAFSESPAGPWTTIASGLRNDGAYVWPADPKLPRQFFLRIDATDSAGNVGTYILDQPIDAQGLAPRARIRGLQSLSGTTPAAPGDQTAILPSGKLK